MTVNIPRVMLLNLDRDTARLEWMEGQFKKLGVSYQRVSAVTPDSMPPEIAARFLPGSERKVMPGDVGCFASHLMALNLIARHGAGGWYVVCEDDLQLEPTFPDILQCEEWTDRFDILRLNGIPKAPTFHLGVFRNWKIVRYIRVPNGTGAYAITRTGAQKVLDSAWDLDLPVDTFLRQTQIHQLRTGGTLPPPVVQDVFGLSSSDPARARQMRPKQKYLARGLSTSNMLRSWARQVLELGPIRSIKYARQFLQMKCSRIKRDPEGRYAVKW